MRVDPFAAHRHDLLAIAMRDLGYAIDAIDVACERAAVLQAEGVEWHQANVAAVREVDAWPDRRRLHRAPAATVAVA